MKRICISIITFMLVLAYTFAEAATLTTQIARVREYLYQTDSTNSTYSDAQITEAINEGQDLLSNLLSYSANHEFIQYNGYASTATSETFIFLDSISVNLKKIISCSVLYPSGNENNITPAIQIKPEEHPIRFYKGTTKDPTFFITNNRLYFWPSNPGGFMVIYAVYLKKYTRLSSGSDTITVQDRYLNALTLAAVWYILQADNQTARAGNIYKLLTDLVTIENNAMVNSNVIERVQGGK